MPGFIPPPEAPVFEPSREEFKDPLAYIAKIRPIAEKSGICKIRPPSEWRPPFSVDVPQFRFTPRVQRLNELEATTRVKLNFLDAVAKYWELQGTTMRLPTVEGSPLDLLKLWKLVETEGGFNQVCKEKRWAQLSQKMGFCKYGQGSVLRNHYEKILFPYHVFKNVQLGESKSGTPDNGAAESEPLPNDRATDKLQLNFASDASVGSPYPADSDEDSEDNKDDAWSPSAEEKKEFGGTVPLTPAADRPSCTVGEATPGAFTHGSSSITTRRSRRMAGGVDPLLSARVAATTATTTAAPGVRDKKNRELQRLQFIAPGPKILQESKLNSDDTDEVSTAKIKEEQPDQAEDKPVVTVTKPDGTLDVDSIVCYSCRHGDGEDCMLLCDVCNASYHTYCLVPPLRGVPPGDWRCPPCVAKECNKPQEAFGFEQADKVYTLHTFQTFANRFKGDYFQTAPHLVPTSDVEQEFWRLVHSIEDDVTVEYGADLHSSDHGSGFPMGQSEENDHQYYTQNGWNLNNLPNLEASVLRHITADISGMKVPWLYVGMCFSSFCWHNEDHWSYSINYLHWGEPKTWYGVPGASASSFEKAMRNAVPELFQDTPDLLHHLVTLISPNALMDQNVPVVRTNQHAGEFVVTFPRAYHAGFNQGYNFAEAVNFCPADWIPHGRSCMAHYQQLQRYTVFAHDELVCKMAMLVNSLDVQMAAELYNDMKVMVENESKLRENISERGVVESEREAFELLPDDERQCRHCQALCFLSAITCPCCPGKLVCLDHADKLCACPVTKNCLRFRYTLSELPAMLLEVENRAQGFTTWEYRVRTALKSDGDNRPTMHDLKALIREASERGFSSDLVPTMEDAIAEAERCTLVAAQLVSVRPRTRHKSADHLISRDELDEFVSQVKKMPCRIDCVQLMRLCETVNTLEETARLAIDGESTDLELLDNLLKEANAATIEIKCLPALELCSRQAKWIHIAHDMVASIPLLSTVCQHLCAVVDLSPHGGMTELINTLKHFQSAGLAFEERIQGILHTRLTVTALEDVLHDSKLVPVQVPSLVALQSMLKSVTQWTKDAQALLQSDDKPEMDTLESLISRSHSLNVELAEVPRLLQIQCDVQRWRSRLQMFIKQSSFTSNPLTILYPRTDVLNRLDQRHKPVNILQRRRSLKSNDEAALIWDLAASELEHVRQVRAHFLSSYIRDCRSSMPVVHGLYCHCRKPLSDCMLRCEVCLNYYHRDCLHADETPDRYGRLLCSLCKRSAKPMLTQAGELYVDLRNINVQVPEATCLRVLIQRAIQWQIQARHSLSAALQIFDERDAAQANHLRTVGVRPFTPSAAEMTKMMQVVNSAGSGAHSNLAAEKRPVDSYLSVAGLRSLDPHVMESLSGRILSVSMCAHLEELMLLGDLLEVSLDEVHLIWTVLKANHQQMNNIRVQPRAPQAGMVAFRSSSKNGHRSPSPEPKKKRKKRLQSDDPAMPGSAASDNSDELCEAKVCLRPSKNCAEVEWVQCDECNLWYHLLCIDLAPHVAHSVEKYSCFRCQEKKPKPAASPTAPKPYGSAPLGNHMPATLIR
eukprot:scpid10968/ scgid26813/ Lysine-specific demethylase 5A; Histone demethylase JARID1A; Jumonji/ARID domain-containing protein 1A; Retinoblastoma-binding protein 2